MSINPWLVLSLGNKTFSLSLLYFNCKCFIDSLFQIEGVPFYSYFSERFLLWTSVEFFQMPFLNHWYDYLISFHYPANVVDYIEWFLNIESVLNPWNKPYWVIIYNSCIAEFQLLICCEGLLCLCSWGLLVWNILFFLYCLWVWYQVNTSFIKWIEKYYFLLYFLGESV